MVKLKCYHCGGQAERLHRARGAVEQHVCGNVSVASSGKACHFPSPTRCMSCVYGFFCMTTISHWLSPVIEPLPKKFPVSRPAPSARFHDFIIHVRRTRL